MQSSSFIADDDGQDKRLAAQTNGATTPHHKG
jgi:hypothetical protein